MTIETGPAQSAPRPAATESKHAKGKPGDAQGQGAGGAVGFMSILASLDAPDLAAPAGGVSADGPSLDENPLSTAMAALARAAGKLKGTGLPADGAQDSVGEDPTNPALNSAGELPVVLSDSANLPLASDVPPDAAALLAQAAQWPLAPAANTDQASLGNARNLASNIAGAAKSPHTPVRPGASAGSSVVAGDSVAEAAGKVGKAQKDAFARLASAQAALTAPADTTNPVADARQTQLMQKMAEAPLGAIATALATATMAVPARREESIRERSVFRTNGSDTASSVNPSSYAPSASPASGPIAPDPVVSTDTYVAEKVAYWISNDVQNAEMKLDGMGDKPVEVSIRMQGNEAHIAFRSDELQARAALENASIHLKDMLQREGLVLSGVSVGTAGAGSSGDQGGKSRQGARQAGVVTVQPAHVERTPGSGRVSGGALDLFV